MRKVDVLDLATGKWSNGPEFPGEDRVGFSPAATVVGNRIVLSTSDRNVYRLLADCSGWEKVAISSAKRMVHRAVPIGPDAILLVGGAGGANGNHTELEVLKLSEAALRSE